MADASASARQMAGDQAVDVTAAQSYRGLRGWIDTVDRLGELSASPARIGTSKWALSPTCSPKRAAASRRQSCLTTCPVMPKASARFTASSLRSNASRSREVASEVSGVV
jgi:hypothetical protein